MKRLKEIINRKPSRWKNLTVKEFERDIALLQESCNHLVIRNEYVDKLQEENEELKSLSLWSIRRLKHQQYKDYAYDEYEKITGDKPERV